MEQQQTGVFFDIARDAIAGDKQSGAHLEKVLSDVDLLLYTKLLRQRIRQAGGEDEKAEADFLMAIARELTKIKKEQDAERKQLEPLHIEF
tara:strand:+ start:147 stop:419 length:273 start_codon:yes stop_codon:yes gene_type:complete